MFFLLVSCSRTLGAPFGLVATIFLLDPHMEDFPLFDPTVLKSVTFPILADPFDLILRRNRLL